MPKGQDPRSEESGADEVAADEDRRIMAAVARHRLNLVEVTGTSNVVSLR